VIYQTDPALPEEIHIFGCYFTSVLFHAERKTGSKFDATKVLAIFNAAKKTGILGDECFVQDPVRLANLAGLAVESVTKAENNAIPDASGFEILHFHRAADTPAGMGNAMHDHFVAGDGHGQVAFDPLGQSNTVKYGYLQNKRIFA
jgi:hypothetical protein